MFSGQPLRRITSDNLFSRFQKLLKNTASFPITRFVVSARVVYFWRAWFNLRCSAQLHHVMGLQHLADGNQKRAVKSLSKALYFCNIYGLKWELVRAAHDLRVSASCSAVQFLFRLFDNMLIRNFSTRMHRPSAHQNSLQS